MAFASTTLKLAGYRAAGAAPSTGAFLSGHLVLGVTLAAAMTLPSLVHDVWALRFWVQCEGARTRTCVAREGKELRQLEGMSASD
jgi:hypothetical protein